MIDAPMTTAPVVNKIGIILIIIKVAKLSIFYLNNYFILRSNTYSESEDKSDLNEYPSLSNF